MKLASIYLYLILAIGTAVCFWQVRNFDFVNYDDNLYVYENPHVLTGLTFDNIIWAFTTNHSANWHPLTWLSLMLDCQLFGANPGWIHLVNVFLHIANTLLLFAVLKKMTGSLWPSAFVAAAFALHPMHIQSVAWISERKDVLSTLFFMLTLLAYCRYAKQRSKGGYFLAMLTFAFGLMTKPMLITLPFLLLLFDYWPLGRFGAIKKKKTDTPQKSFGFLVLEKLPFFVLAVVSSVITFLVQRSGGAVADTTGYPLGSRTVNALVSYASYIGKMFWPQNLTVFYPFCIGRSSAWQVVLYALLLLGILFFVVRLGRKQKYLPVGWFWFIGTLVPVIGIIQVGDQAWADRYTYIPYIGLFIMIAWGVPELLSKWQYRKITLGISMVVVLTALGICTYRQISCWKNSSVLFTHALEVTSNNYLAHSCLAQDAYLQGNNALAIEHFTKTLQIKPDYPSAVLDLGCVTADQGDLDKAIEYFQKTLLLKTNASLAARAHNNLGIAFREQGRFDESFAHFVKAVQLMPDYAEAHYGLANALMQQGRLDEAVDHFRAAVRLKPDWLEPMGSLAELIIAHPEIKNRDINEAIRLASRACELTDYRNPTILDALAAAYASAGNFSQAVETAQKALNLVDPNNKEMLMAIKKRLDLYKASKPYIDAP